MGVLPQGLIDSLRVGVLVTDPDLVLCQVNAWVAENLGVPAADLLGRSLPELFPDLGERGFLAAYEHVQREHQVFSLTADQYRYMLRMPPPPGVSLEEMAQSTTVAPVVENGVLVAIVTIILDASRRVHTELQLRREVATLHALHEIDRVVSTLDLDACLDLIADYTANLFGGVNVALLLREEDRLRVAADRGFPRSYVGHTISLNEGVAGMVVRQRRPTRLPDVTAVPGYIAADESSRSEIAAPLMAHGVCLGVINVESPRPDNFTEADLDILEMLAGRAAAAIHNARLHAAEREQRRLADTLRNIGLALVAELDPEAILDALLEHVGEVVPFDAANVMLLDAAGQRVRIARHRGYERFNVQHHFNHFDVPLDYFSNLAHMAVTRRPHFVSHTDTDPTWVYTEYASHIRSWAGAPIVARGRLLGFLSLDKVEPGFYTARLVERLEAFAAQAGLALENARLYAEQQRLAITDALTGVANRRHFDQELERELVRGARFQHPTSLIMLDIDDFKHYNDAYGHQRGDELLQVLALLISQSLRAVDTLARYGGEEFAVILPSTGGKAARQAAERIRLLVESVPIGQHAETNAPVTISLGVAVAPNDATTLRDLVAAADAALYRAKRRGKNCVAVYDEGGRGV